MWQHITIKGLEIGFCISVEWMGHPGKAKSDAFDTRGRSISGHGGGRCGFQGGEWDTANRGGCGQNQGCGDVGSRSCWRQVKSSSRWLQKNASRRRVKNKSARMTLWRSIGMEGGDSTEGGKGDSGRMMYGGEEESR